MKTFALTLLGTLLLTAASAMAATFAEGNAAYKRGDFARAYSIMRTLATQSEPRAQSNLAFMYRTGQGVARNYDEAFKWY